LNRILLSKIVNGAVLQVFIDTAVKALRFLVEYVMALALYWCLNRLARVFDVKTPLVLIQRQSCFMVQTFTVSLVLAQVGHIINRIHR
jgi:hypothetical protein